ncbi:MAG: hypothetical protein ACOVNY_07335 [Chitinophagaceae bacterium]
MLAKTDIEKYFIAEKQAGLFFLMVGLVAIILAAVGLFVLKHPICKGAAIPLIVIGLTQVAVGFTIYKRSDADRIRVVYDYDMNKGAIKEKELPRMVIIDKNFIVYRWFQMILLIFGLILVFYNKVFMDHETDFETIKNSFRMGVGAAMIVQAIILLSADYFAEKRANAYTQQLKQFVKKIDFGVK